MQHPGRIALVAERPRRAGHVLVLGLGLAGCGSGPMASASDAGSDTAASTSDATTPTSGDVTSTAPTSTSGPDGDTASTDPATTDTGDTGPIAEWQFVTLAEQTFMLNGGEVAVEFIRAERPDGGRSYLLYQHAPAAKAPLVIQTQPYAGIDWTGEEVDERWAQMGNGGHPDVDAPDYNDKDMVAYTLQDPAEAVGSNNVWAFNGFAAIHAYGRFYAGGALADDVLDAVAPYAFARTRPDEIDLARIGAFGSSWGGMMALFGASQAPQDAAPRIVVPISAPSDFVELWTWSTDTFPAQSLNPAMVTGFYSPYWRRAKPTLGTPPGAGAEPYTHAGLCPGLPGTLVLPHDAWDAIIPVTQTQGLAAACANVEPLYWPRATPLDLETATMTHGPFASEGLLPSVLIYTYAALVVSLAPPEANNVYSLTSGPSLVLHLELVLAEQKAGKDVGWILPRLRELADPRLQTLVAETNQLQPSAEVLASAVNEVWSTAFDADGLRAQLEIGLPDPP
ncbi:alpha/beta hydrolase family protein [Nannocystis radixulma]|uniref:CocE/NonD family hydrolase n=1 Tax=Nannocystis radixulma TaxID=2995305 RepID=A0ABT5B4Q5_9BACT|nr:CocE/NonD family hydrolase [Nannocystis radixulma]MDC0668046.1 CocE/NonD family hydrolase [Nannocystis radixulma]